MLERLFSELGSVDVNAFRTTQDTLAVEHIIELWWKPDAICLDELAREPPRRGGSRTNLLICQSLLRMLKITFPGWNSAFRDLYSKLCLTTLSHHRPQVEFIFTAPPLFCPASERRQRPQRESTRSGERDIQVRRVSQLSNGEIILTTSGDTITT